jgi:RNA polymerase sigma-70 factor (ECF subfamily)
MATETLVLDNGQSCNEGMTDAAVGSLDIAELVGCAQHNRQDALDELVDRVQPALYRYLLATLRNPDIAEEVLQEVMVKVVRSLDCLRDPRGFHGWLYRIASNEVKNFYRDRRRAAIRFSALHEEAAEQFAEEDQPTADQAVIASEIGRHLTDAVAGLKTFHRRIVMMRCYEQLSYAQISDRIGCSETNARSGFARAKRQIRSRLQRLGLTGS